MLVFSLDGYVLRSSGCYGAGKEPVRTLVFRRSNDDANEVSFPLCSDVCIH